MRDNRLSPMETALHLHATARRLRWLTDERLRTLIAELRRAEIQGLLPRPQTDAIVGRVMTVSNPEGGHG